MLNAFARKGAPAVSLLQRWPGPGRARLAFAIGYGMAAIVTALAIWLVASAPGSGPIAPASRILLLVLGLNLLLIVVLASVVGARVVRLARDRKADAGARLHLRFVTLFAAAAVVPAVVVAVFFGGLVTRGVESWFSERVRSAVENGAQIARSYVDQQVQETSSDLNAMSSDLGDVRNVFESRLTFTGALQSLAQIRGFDSAYILNGQGQVLAFGEGAGAQGYRAPPPLTLERAATGEMQVGVYGSPDAVRAVYRLPDYDNAYLYVVRLLKPGTLARLRSADNAIADYREAERSRARVQAAFVLAYMETALLVLVGAVWLGMTAAGQISEPVGRLVQAADRVAGGDLSARVDTERDPEEIAVLSRAFNRMTSDLETQQDALRTASVEAQARSRFIETVLSGVSAGVLGLDQNGRVSALNEQAVNLLGLEDNDPVGKPLAKAAPELARVVAKAAEGEGEQDVDVTRGQETRRLRVRVSGGEEGGLVLTFDDITRLMTAQRNAAWRDVARRIAHEIKNPLTPIQLSAERLRRKYRDQISGDLDTFDRCTDTIIRQVGDIGRMVDEFSAFARMPTPKFATEDAAELLRQAVFAQRVANPDIDLQLIEPAPSLPFVADGRMVAQALTNVLKNAGEAVVAKRAQDPDAPNRMTARLLTDEDSLIFVVEDDGVGLPAKDRDRLTEPYVTTREKGTGLGLAIVKRICEDHGGELLLGDAVELNGARVALRFPKARKGVAETPATGA
jgi:two-component system nitrogen regulation sensor histidine kinase NtrY